MKLNMGTVDRVLRLAVAVIIGILYYLGFLNGTIALVLGGLAIVFALTSAVSFCPLYTIFGLSTRPKA